MLTERNFVQLRPPLELKETLLHEMIHAWVRLTHQKDTGQGSNSGHGSAFQAKMLHINTSAAPDYQVCSLHHDKPRQCRTHSRKQSHGSVIHPCC